MNKLELTIIAVILLLVVPLLSAIFFKAKNSPAVQEMIHIAGGVDKFTYEGRTYLTTSAGGIIEHTPLKDQTNQ